MDETMYELLQGDIAYCHITQYLKPVKVFIIWKILLIREASELKNVTKSGKSSQFS